MMYKITIKNCPVCLDFQAAQMKDKMMSYEVPAKLLEQMFSH